MTRSFKVQGHGDAWKGTRKVGAELRFRGQWLKLAGFEPGARVQAVVRRGYIELAVIEERQPDAAFLSAMAGFERMGV